MIENIVSNNGHKYVDLDLPSGTLWAICNVGAERHSESGLYFQWGDIQGYKFNQIGTGTEQKKFAEDWSDYKWNPSGDGKTFTKYTTKGDMLDLKDDAAHVYMGGSWHMPTPKQCRELINNTINTWRELNSGVKGTIFTSKKDKSKSIFIPAAGFARNGLVSNIRDFGCVWSSMMMSTDYCQFLVFNLRGAGINGDQLCYGMSVRGVIG